MALISFTVITVAFIAAIFFTWFFIHKSKEEERRLLIEKGIEPSKLSERGTFNINFPWLKIGCVIVFATLGLIVGVILSEERIVRWSSGGEPLMSMLIFGGIGMIIAHYLDTPNDKS